MTRIEIAGYMLVGFLAGVLVMADLIGPPPYHVTCEETQ